MSNGRLSPVVLACREQLAVGRAKLRRQHDTGTPGMRIGAGLAALADDILLQLYRDAQQESGFPVAKLDEGFAVVAYAGYARRDMALGSDVDVMMLHAPGADKEYESVVRRFTQSVFDVGLALGFSLRGPVEACQLALTDAQIFTSLTETRLLHGNEALLAQFRERFRRVTRRRSRRLLQLVEAARKEERKKFGETNFLLEPNIKCSSGGLRDLQFIRWLGFLRCGEVELDDLFRRGLLAREELQRLTAARDFLLKLRNDLHFHAGKAQDLLTREEQVRLAKLYQYPGAEGVLPVEQFMRDYFKHTSEVRNIAANALADAQPVKGVLSLLEPLVTYRLDGDFRVGPRRISVAKQGLARVCQDPVEILRLMELANLTNRRIDPGTWSAIRESMLKHPEFKITPEVSARFMALLMRPGALGDLLRRLHELRVLEKLIPPMIHARCLLQFNDFHRFTVDEHSIRCVECATEFQERADTLGQVYNKLTRKDMLHLALLLHDLGKGYPDDHSEVGKRLAEDTGRHLGLSDEDVDTLKFLVHKHLVMSHLAQWRDISDNAVVVKFAVEVATPERLQLLYVLTCADLAGVGPNVLTDWKLRLLTDLYHSTMRHIAGDPQDLQGQEYLKTRRADVVKLVPSVAEAEWWQRHLAALPRSYMLSREPRQIVEELERLRHLERDGATAWGRYLRDERTVEYTIGTYEDITPGIFHKLTGALTSKRLQILSAEINTLGEGLVLDRFLVEDRDYADEPPQDRIDEVCRALVSALRDTSGKPPEFRAVYGRSSQNKTSAFNPEPTVVKLDNSSSEHYTVIDVFTIDRMGLLYTITRTLFELGLSVGVAKIGTHLNQVVDVFYVTDRDGGKVRDDDRLKLIRNRLHEAIEQAAADGKR